MSNIWKHAENLLVYTNTEENEIQFFAISSQEKY